MNWWDRAVKVDSVQFDDRLRKGVDAFYWFCQGCREMHPLYVDKGWTFNGNWEKPTFSPSFLHTWKGLVNGQQVTKICHYILTDGIVNYCGDCTHRLVGQSVPLPNLPDFMRDDYVHSDAEADEE